jgi:hypothetical protein
LDGSGFLTRVTGFLDCLGFTFKGYQKKTRWQIMFRLDCGEFQIVGLFILT